MERRVMKGCARIICNCRVATRSDFATQQDRANTFFPSDNGTEKARCRALENRKTRARHYVHIFIACHFCLSRCRQSALSRPTMYRVCSLLIYLIVKGKRHFSYSRISADCIAIIRAN